MRALVFMLMAQEGNGSACHWKSAHLPPDIGCLRHLQAKVLAATAAAEDFICCRDQAEDELKVVPYLQAGSEKSLRGNDSDCSTPDRIFFCFAIFSPTSILATGGSMLSVRNMESGVTGHGFFFLC